MEKDDIKAINESIDRLERNINSILEMLEKRDEYQNSYTLSSTNIENSIKTLKVTIDDLENYYNKVNFETFYAKCREFEDYEYSKFSGKDFRFLDNTCRVDCWDDSCLSGETKMSRIVQALVYFNIDKIVDHIVAINLSNCPHIESMDVEDNLSKEEWKNCLLGCLKSVIQSVMQYGEADENSYYKEYQSGRIHLDSMLMKYEDTTANRLNLYWTDEAVDAYPTNWDEWKH